MLTLQGQCLTESRQLRARKLDIMLTGLKSTPLNRHGHPTAEGGSQEEKPLSRLVARVMLNG